ncbi:oxidoreductase [Haemophilus influenzae]|uniref:Oxidoreductase n=1 Tax=Haemophilus influenzae TaxID=727 RepID=A0A2X1PN05_HAEIF|nr:oxidoreductase [Haemophilus influenzae]
MLKTSPTFPFIYTFHGAFKNALIVIFNSHTQKGDIPEQDYIYHLLQDLQADLQRFKDAIQQRKLHSIFIGGGTPSLFSAESIAYLLKEIKKQIDFEDNIEITLEANPGTVEAERFKRLCFSRHYANFYGNSKFQ